MAVMGFPVGYLELVLPKQLLHLLLLLGYIRRCLLWAFDHQWRNQQNNKGGPVW